MLSSLSDSARLSTAERSCSHPEKSPYRASTREGLLFTLSPCAGRACQPVGAVAREKTGPGPAKTCDGCELLRLFLPSPAA